MVGRMLSVNASLCFWLLLLMVVVVLVLFSLLLLIVAGLARKTSHPHLLIHHQSRWSCWSPASDRKSRSRPSRRCPCQRSQLRLLPVSPVWVCEHCAMNKKGEKKETSLALIFKQSAQFIYFYVCWSTVIQLWKMGHYLKSAWESECCSSIGQACLCMLIAA